MTEMAPQGPVTCRIGAEQVAPDPDQMLQFLQWLTREWSALGEHVVIEVSAIPAEGGIRRPASFDIEKLDNAVKWALQQNAGGDNVYVVVNPKRAEARDHAAKDNDIVAAFFHFADGDDEASAELLSGAEVSGSVITGTAPHPRQHAYWRLTEPCRDLDAWRNTQRAIARTYRADGQCVNPARLMRLAGSLSYPSSKKAAKHHVTELVTASLSDLVYDEVPGISTGVAEVDAPLEARQTHVASHRASDDPHLLNLLRSRRNALPVSALLSEADWKDTGDRSAWLKLIFGMHARYFDTRLAGEARQEVIEFSARWEDAPKGRTQDQLRDAAAKVWDMADPNGRVGPGTAFAILRDLPALGPTDVEVQPQISEPLDESNGDNSPIQLSGLAGELAELVRNASKRDVTVLPEAGALMAMSALAAPYFTIKGPEGQAPLNLFGLVLGDTGVGKEVVRQIVRSVLKSANRDLEFFDTVSSDRGLHTALAKRRGKATLAIDEAGLSLEALRKGTQPHQRALVTFAMKLFGLGLYEISAHEYADGKKALPAVSSPRLTMIWTSTSGAFEKATGQEDSESGQLNRFVLFQEPGLPALKTDGIVNRDKVWSLPRDVHRAVRKFMDNAIVPTSAETPHATVVKMADEASRVIQEFERGEVEEMIRQGGAAAESWSRAVEQALRISGLLALSDAAMGKAKSISNVTCEVRHVETAVLIVRRGLAGTIEVARNAGRTEIEHRKDEVLAAIRMHADAGGWARARDVHRHGRLRGLKKRDRDDLIEAMITDGEIVSQKSRQTRGRPGDVYGVAREKDMSK